MVEGSLAPQEAVQTYNQDRVQKAAASIDDYTFQKVPGKPLLAIAKGDSLDDMSYVADLHVQDDGDYIPISGSCPDHTHGSGHDEVGPEAHNAVMVENYRAGYIPATALVRNLAKCKHLWLAMVYSANPDVLAAFEEMREELDDGSDEAEALDTLTEALRERVTDRGDT